MNKTQNEIWKDVKGYEGKYQVSNLGRVKNIDYHNRGIEFILNTRTDKITGYRLCSIGLVHRIVLETFNPIEDMKNYQCDHINSIRDDNRLENLRWVSRKENNSTKHSMIMRSRNHKTTSHKNQFIKGVYEDGSIDYFKNIQDASNRIGCSTTLVVTALKTDRQWKAKGWKLEYISRDADECKELKENIIKENDNKIRERKEAKIRARIERKEAKKIARMKDNENKRKESRRRIEIKKVKNIIKRIENRISVWNAHTTNTPSDAKDRNLKKLCEMLSKEQFRLKFLSEMK